MPPLMLTPIASLQISFDWANRENSWHSKPVPYPDQADLLTQAQMVKKASKNKTKVFVYRQGQGVGSPAGKQAQDLLTNPIYDGFFLKSNGCPPSNSSCGALPKGKRVGPFEFRNETLVQVRAAAAAPLPPPLPPLLLADSGVASVLHPRVHWRQGLRGQQGVA